MTLNKTNIILQLIFVVILHPQLAGMEITYSANAIVANPVECLKKIRTTDKPYCQDLKNINLTLPTLKENYISCIKKHEQTCPLFLLDECTQVTCSNKILTFPCAFSRLKNPAIRESFEKRTSDLLSNKINEAQGQLVTYTGFGCGEAFQDLIIITKALMTHQKAHLNIHLIDDNNTSYSWATDFLNHCPEIKTDDIFLDFESRLPELAQHVREINQNIPEIQNMPSETLQQQLAFSCLKKEVQYKQFIKWLAQQFPESKIALYCHNVVQTYCNFLQNNNLAHADIITASDIDDQGAIEMGAICEYAALCKATLNAKPTSNSAWLIRTHDYAAIAVARLLGTQGATQISFDHEDL